MNPVQDVAEGLGVKCKARHCYIASTTEKVTSDLSFLMVAEGSVNVF